ncbi:uncharacterized protein LOC104583568 isoform X3 [Brachypodium distachyon]|uniref:uncharacterized protein LOC104583568 isoform X3 n=1 Tax=Brachypodium distachyon TaxID=15368 RepID=UPI000D0D9749|nr:uncharacterized protein LOC104583568 isoform X3 [Brachypodium distachyon]|eukprot:XP_024316881.1 uncharacterized protein LOC104583568 isoform X3 [Brachypodium distachyon]
MRCVSIFFRDFAITVLVSCLLVVSKSLSLIFFSRLCIQCSGVYRGSDVRSDRNDCSVHSDSDYCPFEDEGEHAAANAGGPAACDFDGYSSEDYSETDLIIDNISDLGKGSHGQSEGPLQVVDLDGLNNQENINLQCEKNQSYEEMIQEHVLKPCQPPRCAVPRVVQKWTPQLAGKVSFNVDVVVFSANSSSDIGVMVREHLGHRLMPCRQSFEDTTSAELAEAQALRCAMVLAREENFHNILVQIICS